MSDTVVLDRQSRLNWIANYIWGIADDVLRDLYVRGKYRDVILPITVLRRPDSLPSPRSGRMEPCRRLDAAGTASAGRKRSADALGAPQVLAHLDQQVPRAAG